MIDNFQQHAKELAYKSKGYTGNLFVFAIQKSIINNPSTNIVYMSKPFGQPISGQSQILYLEPAQNGYFLLNGQRLPPHASLHSVDQARILASHLNSADQIKIFEISPLPKKMEKENQQEIETIVKPFTDELLQHIEISAKEAIKHGKIDQISLKNIEILLQYDNNRDEILKFASKLLSEDDQQKKYMR